MNGAEPVTVAVARQRARRRYDSLRSHWAIAEAMGDDSENVPVPVPGGMSSPTACDPAPAEESSADELWAIALHPPTERQALADIPAVVRWQNEWAALGPIDGLLVDWEPRAWAAAGHQTVPVRARFVTVEALVQFAGRQSDWARILHAVHAITDRWPADVVIATADRAGYRAALVSLAGQLAKLDEADLSRLIDVLDWTARHPEPGWYLRQLPVRGVHTKWIERHRRLVGGLLPIVAGRTELGYATPEALIRIRILDDALALHVAGLTQLAVTAAEWNRLALPVRRVLIVENLETFVCLPPVAGGVAVWGHGYAVSLLACMRWPAGTDVVYWGDLDRDGFTILATARAALPQTRSLMMDTSTLQTCLDLAGDDTGSNRVPDPALLTETERQALTLLHDEGDVRLEQERIPWEYVVDALRRAGFGPAE